MEALCVGPISERHRPAALHALGLHETPKIHFLGDLHDTAEVPGTLARCGNQLLGVTLYTLKENRMLFLRTAVASPNPALLQALLTCTERQALHRGCRVAQLYLQQPPSQAVRAYQGLGYRVVALYPASVSGHLGAEHGQDIVELEKSLQRARQFAF